MMNKALRLLALTTSMLLSVAGISAGSPMLIDFETYPDGSQITAGTAITDQFTSWGITFDLVPPSAATQLTYVSNDLPTVSPNNFLAPGGPKPNLGGTLILNFSTPVIDVGSFFIDDQREVAVTAFDTNLDPVTTVYSDGNPIGFDSWSISHSLGISRVELVGGILSQLWDWEGNIIETTYDAWGIDDLSYTQIPEPASLLLLALGGSCSSLFSRMRRFKTG